MKIFYKKLKTRLLYWVPRLFFGTLDLLFFILLVPLFSLMCGLLLVIRLSRKKTNTALFTGLEHVLDKTAVRGRYFEEQNFDVYYYSFEMSNNRSMLVNKEQVFKAKSFVSIDLIKYLIVLSKVKPMYVELYFEGLGINQVFYAFYSRIQGSLVVSIFRGGELYYYQFRKKILKAYLCILAGHISHKILYREIYMASYFEQFKIPKQKSIFDYNKIPIKQEPTYRKENIKVLFLNSIKKWRRVELLVEACSFIKGKFPNFELVIVGARNEKEYSELKYLTCKYGVIKGTKLHHWTNDPYEYISSASIFVLPADLVFCNFSLLQSMEQGLVPIVSNVEDADKIINHGINGFLVEQDPRDIAKYLSLLIENECVRLEMGKQARKTIIEKFNDKDRMTPIMELMKEKHSYLNPTK